ncbi:MAG TPA: cytochrome b N-terminal domain-containing protein [Candidatus Kapabacteria bacterium]|nr:cytochrome b N-terminal domain-containing protein [Candidatus Kapabacteria bacterium]
MKKIFDWLDHRTGYKKITHEALYENIPGGARWRYVWGSTLSFALLIQFVTGIFLWMAYSPSSQTAWESVYYIQYEMTGGWLLRGLHHYTAQIMTILLVLHLMQVVIDGAYKAPRELNFIFGVLLLLLTLGLSLTGYLLPWDQKGYWATKVSTNLAAITPVIGPLLQKIIIGGTDYGHHTLTRFFALHAGLLPAAVIALLVLHIYLFRRHGITPKQPLRRKDQAFWPDQVLKDAVACLAVLVTVLVLIWLPRLRDSAAPLGAELGAPADPSEAFSAARPEWYFLFLFQFLKYFPGSTEIVGAIIIPSLALFFLLVMPFIGRWKLGHRFNIAFLVLVLAGAGLLTFLAKAQDGNDPSYIAAVQQSEESAHRVRALAQGGIPREGALSLLQNDPLTQGPRLFARHCASCHRYDGHDGLGLVLTEGPSAPDLKGFASRDWVSKLLDPAHIASSNFYGGTKFKDGKMVRFVNRTIGEFNAEQKERLKKVVAAVSAEGRLPSQSQLDRQDRSLIEEGRLLVASDEMRCTECHQFRKRDEDATAPDLTGYGSQEWLTAIINNPAHERFYGKRNDRMPAFGDGARLDEKSVAMLVSWLRGETNSVNITPVASN